MTKFYSVDDRNETEKTSITWKENDKKSKRELVTKTR